MSGAKSADEIQRDYVAAMGADLGGQFYCLWNECSWLHTTWRQYEHLFGSGPQRVEILNGAAGVFFRIVQDTLWEATLLHLSRLTDQRKDTLTLTRLPVLVDDKVRPQVEAQLAEVLTCCRFARDWRHRHIAHRNLGLALAEPMVPPLAAASCEKVNAAMEAIADLLNVVERHYRDATTIYAMADPVLNAEAMLYVLRDGLKFDADRRKRLESGHYRPEDWPEDEGSL